MRMSGACGGGLVYLFRDVGVLKNLEVSDGYKVSASLTWNNLGAGD